MFNFKSFDIEKEFYTLIQPLIGYWEQLPDEEQIGMFKELLSGILMTTIVTLKEMPPSQSTQLINLCFQKTLTEQELADKWHSLTMKFGAYHIAHTAYLMTFILLVTRVADMVKEMEERGEELPTSGGFCNPTEPASEEESAMIRMLVGTKFTSMN